MLALMNRFSKYSIVIFVFLAITFSHAQDERAEDISILDVDASGEVDALTDGLLLLRSMFGLTDDVLTTGVVSADATVSDATSIDSYITSIKDTTYGKLNSSGEPGPAGPQGEKGDKGDTGPQGEKGDTGSQGIQGVKGDTGSQGIAGTDGVDGAKGDTGATGAKGDTGATGVQGIQGIKGDTGSQGLAGAKGDTGEKGAKGDTGSQGVAGANGTDGSDGANGASGGAVGISFSMELTGSPTSWSNNAPPQNLIVDSQGPYILYTGEDSNNNGIIPLLAKNFEFIHLEGNSFSGGPTPSPGDFPIEDFIQQNNIYTTPINGHKLPQLGPQPTGSTIL